LQIPAKIRNFLQSKFTQEQYNRLISEINSTARKAEIRHFDSMIKVASSGVSELNEFQSFTVNFDGAFSYYISNETDVDAIDILSRFCPTTNLKTKSYYYYSQQINSLKNICK
jgi:hypothetical protein